MLWWSDSDLVWTDYQVCRSYQTKEFESRKPYLGDYIIVIQLDLENDNSWYQLLPDAKPFNKPSLFKPAELGYITQFPTFEMRCGGMYTPK